MKGKIPLFIYIISVIIIISSVVSFIKMPEYIKKNIKFMDETGEDQSASIALKVSVIVVGILNLIMAAMLLMLKRKVVALVYVNMIIALAAVLLTGHGFFFPPVLLAYAAILEYIKRKKVSGKRLFT